MDNYSELDFGYQIAYISNCIFTQNKNLIRQLVILFEHAHTHTHTH